LVMQHSGVRAQRNPRAPPCGVVPTPHSVHAIKFRVLCGAKKTESGPNETLVLYVEHEGFVVGWEPPHTVWGGRSTYSTVRGGCSRAEDFECGA